MNYLILNPILAEYQVTELNLFERSITGRIKRKRELVMSRQIYYYMERKYEPKRSLASIGSDFFQDHATVLHAIKTISNLIETDKEFALIIDDIEDKIEQSLREKDKFVEYEEVEAALICNYRGLNFGMIYHDIGYVTIIDFPSDANNGNHGTLFEAKTYFEDSLKKFLAIIK